MNELIFGMQNINLLSINNVGAKAYNLAYLSDKGISIPNAIFLNTKALDLFFIDNSIDKKKRLDNFDKKNMNELKNTFSSIKNDILNGEISSTMKKSLKNTIIKNFEISKLNVSVRSSAISEDKNEASFSGIFHTSLNVVSLDEVYESIKKCWASLYSTHAINFIKENKININEYGMAIILQEMISPDASGVVFTSDPVSGDRNLNIINANYGLGHGIVSGETPIDTFIIDSKKNEIIDLIIEDKKYKFEKKKKHGIKKVRQKKEKRFCQCIKDDLIIKLSNLCNDIENYFSQPQDIEFAIRNNNVFILQSRPIVGLPDSFFLNVNDKIINDSGYKLEFGDWFSPIGRNIEFIKNKIYRKSAADLYGNKIENVQIAINGYIYHKEFHVVRKNKYVQFIKKIIMLLRCISYKKLIVNRFYHNASEFKRSIIEIDRMIKFDNNQDILPYAFESSLKNYLKMEKVAAKVGVMANLFTGILLTLSKFTDSFNNNDFLNYISSVENETLNRTKKWKDLIFKYQGLLLKKTISFRNIKEFNSSLLKEPGGYEFLHKLKNFNQKYGYIWADRTTKDVGWRTNHKFMLDNILSILRNHEGKNNPQFERKSDYENKKKLSFSSKSYFFSEVVSIFFDISCTLYPLKEDYNHYLSKGSMHMNKILCLIGKCLVKENVINNYRDVFFFDIKSLVFLFRSRSHLNELTKNKVKQKVKNEILKMEKQKKLNPPPYTKSRIANQKIVSSQKIIKGYACSPGLVKGTAFVGKKNNLGDISDGEILICENIRPEWSSVFPFIKAIVSDKGYLLSHGANLARESKIPAVLGTNISTQKIISGDRLIVDGNAGTVEIVSRNNEF